MPRVPETKVLINTRLANSYGGWIYCDHCDKTIGYLCYVTYDSLDLEYTCSCGGSGKAHISFLSEPPAFGCQKPLISIKNRLCCPSDQSPLLSINKKRLSNFRYTVVCNRCGTMYCGEKLPNNV